MNVDCHVTHTTCEKMSIALPSGYSTVLTMTFIKLAVKLLTVSEDESSP